MSLTVTTLAPTRRLTTRDQVIAKLGSGAVPSSDYNLVDDIIARSSDAIERWCNRTFAREALTELVPGYGNNRLMVSRTPIVTVTAVLYNGAVLTDVTVDDAERGFLYRQPGMFWTTQLSIGLSGRTRFPGIGSPQPLSEEPLFSLSYLGGWILPPQDLRDPTLYPASKTSGGVTVSGADNSFNDSNAGFPPMLQAGDVIESAGWTNAANNGRFFVAGTPTASKIPVSATLVTEASPAQIKPSIIVHNLPGAIEEACVEEVKSRYLDRGKAPHTRRERVGDLDMEWTDPAGVAGGLCVNAAGLLLQFRRVV